MPLAHEAARAQRDEDNLNREGNNHEVDEFLTGVAKRLCEGPAGIRSVRLVARSLEDLAQVVIQHDDNEAIEEAYRAAHRALNDLTR